MAKKKDDVTNEAVVAETPTVAEQVAVPAYDVADKYKNYVGILVGTKLVKVTDGKVFADNELHKTLAEGGFLK